MAKKSIVTNEPTRKLWHMASGDSFSSPLTIGHGRRTQIEGKKLAAMYTDKAFAERLKGIDFVDPKDGATKYAMLLMEFNSRFKDVAELAILEAVLTPESNSHSVSEWYYDYCEDKSEVAEVLDFFGLSATVKMETFVGEISSMV